MPGRVDTILFVVASRGSFPTVEAVASVVRSRRIRAIGCYVNSPPPEGVYDAGFYCGGDPALLRDFLRGSRQVDLVYVQAHARQVHLGRMVKEILPGVKVVQEVYDWMETVVPDAERAEAEGYFTKNELSRIIACERWLRDNLDGFIYKNTGRWMEAACRRARAPSLRLLPCHSARLRKRPVPRRGGAPRLLFTGKIAPSSWSRSYYGDVMLEKVFQVLLRQGMEVTAYPTPVVPVDSFERQYAEYHTLARLWPAFRFEPPASLDQVIAVGRDFDYGLMLYSFEGVRVGKEHLKGAMASKMFTYLAAGLPVLVSRELESMAAFVERHQVGLVLSDDMLPRLREALETVDLHRLKENVEKVQERYVMENFAGRLLRFFDMVVSRD